MTIRGARATLDNDGGLRVEVKGLIAAVGSTKKLVVQVDFRPCLPGVSGGKPRIGDGDDALTGRLANRSHGPNFHSSVGSATTARSRHAFARSNARLFGLPSLHIDVQASAHFYYRGRR